MKRFSLVLTSLSFLLLLGACSKDKNPNGDSAEGDFVMWMQLGSWPNTNYYVLGVKSLSEGTAELSGNGVDVTNTLNNSVILRNGYYYFYNTAEGRFGKHQIADGQVQTLKEVPYTHMASLSGHTWVDDTHLVLVGTNSAGSEVRYSVINTTDLTITNGVVEGVPALQTGYTKYRVGGDVQYVNGNLFFALIQLDGDNLAYNGTYVLQVPYATFKVGDVSLDTRVSGVGNTSGYFQTSFVDENKDAYFLYSWDALRSAGTYGPRGIFRIKNGSTKLDASFYVDLEAEIGSLASAGVFMNLGGGKAILKYDLGSDRTNTKYGYLILNLSTGKVIRKLTELPEGAASERNVYVENGKAYIAVLSGQDKDYIWIYDVATDKVTKGLEIAGGYNSYSRIDRLK